MVKSNKMYTVYIRYILDKSHAIGARNELKKKNAGCEPVVYNVNELIHKKQYHALQIIKPSCFVGRLEKIYLGNRKRIDEKMQLFLTIGQSGKIIV